MSTRIDLRGAVMDGHNKVNILLVDDQPARLLTYQSVLSELGQNLVTAHSGVEALGKLLRDEYAVVLLDVSMPDMDGFETAQMIQEHPRYRHTPIIFVTGVHITELDRLKGYELGAVDYVSVPVVPEILRSKVAVLIELFCKRRELGALNASLTEANARLATANEALQAEKTRELEALNATLRNANSELERTNQALLGEVTARSRMERALKAADQKKDEFLAMLAHELRNPLAPLLNAVELMRLQECNPQLSWAREVIERQVHHLTRLVDDLLDVSRITHGKIALNRVSLDMSALVERAVETIHPLIKQRRQQLSVAMPDESLRVHGDQVRLVQAVSNVLGNAVKFSEPEGHIDVRVYRRDDCAVVNIRDDGIGIPPDQMSRIFDLFTRVDHGIDRPQSGLGIGLALVRRLVEMHGGTVTARSEGAWSGSEFEIQLPLAAATARQDREPPPEVAEPAKVMRRRILVADDNLDAVESTVRLLRHGGHEVFSASDGNLALQAAEHHLPEVILLDIGMPGLDGYEVARRIRSRPWGRDVTLVAITGWGQESDRRLSKAAGFDRHLIKPVDSASLAELLANVPPANPVPYNGPAVVQSTTAAEHGI